ncbi:MAG: decarboxylating 6-phosphogluconate dehydrogenase [Tissierellia bacterium]|nr:decarboxylating 6-phosphogluconate dehydrogenase [Tissierellia bacterium]
MKIGIIGLGKMGYNLALNLQDKGYEVIAYNRSSESVDLIKKEGITGTTDLSEFIKLLPKPRIIWIMIPAGEAVDEMLERLAELVDKRDILMDGGNSHYKDTLKRYEMLKNKDISYVDIGTSGGISGARKGACTMIGAEDETFKVIEPIMKAMSVENGYLHVGKNGSGHYVKMIHNAIEYGMMQSIGEGFQLLQASQFDLNYEDVARVWNNGSVIRSWLMELSENLFAKDPNLEKLRGVIDSSGEGLWSLQEALELKVSTPVLAMSLFTRFSSKDDNPFSNRVVAGLRNEFGGHDVTKS